jgi:hypothetical protein
MTWLLQPWLWWIIVFGMKRLTGAFISTTTIAPYLSLSLHTPVVSSTDNLDNDDEGDENDRKVYMTNPTTRRKVLSDLSSIPAVASVTSLVSVSSSTLPANAADATDKEVPLPSTVKIPLEWIPSLNAYVIYFWLFDERFGAILDTGSPFLTVPFRCNKFAYKYRWGCYQPEKTRDSGYANSVEVFVNNQGTVVWRKADFRFVPNATETQDVVFGVLSEDLMDGPGGVFFGLLRETDKWIRPSFLGQTGYTNFLVDFRNTSASHLVLSKDSLFQEEEETDTASSSLSLPSLSDYIPLVRDLHKRYKCPVVHYTSMATSLTISGQNQDLDKRPTYVIFDTGVTGMLLSERLFEGRYQQARQNREKSLWNTVELTFQTAQGNTMTLTATKPVTTSLGTKTSFKGFRGNLIVAGLAFFDGRALAVDTENDQLQIFG